MTNKTRAIIRTVMAENESIDINIIGKKVVEELAKMNKNKANREINSVLNNLLGHERDGENDTDLYVKMLSKHIASQNLVTRKAKVLEVGTPGVSDNVYIHNGKTYKLRTDTGGLMSISEVEVKEVRDTRFFNTTDTELPKSLSVIKEGFSKENEAPTDETEEKILSLKSTIIMTEKDIITAIIEADEKGVIVDSKLLSHNGYEFELSLKYKSGDNISNFMEKYLNDNNLVEIDSTNESNTTLNNDVENDDIDFSVEEIDEIKKLNELLMRKDETIKLLRDEIAELKRQREVTRAINKALIEQDREEEKAPQLYDEVMGTNPNVPKNGTYQTPQSIKSSQSLPSQHHKELPTLGSSSKRTELPTLGSSSKRTELPTLGSSQMSNKSFSNNFDSQTFDELFMTTDFDNGVIKPKTNIVDDNLMDFNGLTQDHLDSLNRINNISGLIGF